MPATVELSGVSVILVGSFNPAIFQPAWFASQELLPENIAEHAREDLVATPQLTAFTGDWLSLQVSLEQAIFSTIEEAREPDLRDLVKGVLEALPHTPIDAYGINSDLHFKEPTEEQWHAFGDRLAPKQFWQPFFPPDEWLPRAGSEDQTVGLRNLQVEGWRPNLRDYVRVQVAPSQRITPFGVYVGINAHFQLTDGEARGTGHKAAEEMADNWRVAREVEGNVENLLMELIP